jgi:hypothetical protein
MIRLLRFGLRWLFRIVILATIAVLAVLWIEPQWFEDSRTLSLRLRRGGEALEIARGWIRSGGPELPPVASSLDELTEQDRRRLERLLEEKLRD